MPEAARASVDVMQIDSFVLARDGGSLAGTIGLDQLSRVDALRRDGALSWRLSGRKDERGRPFLELAVQGSIPLLCQRCLSEVDVPLDFTSRFLVAADEAEADAVPMDEDDFDVIVGARDFDVDALIEDEVILGLPLVAKHVHCPEPLRADGDAKAEPPSPFAVLAKLRGRGDRS